MLAIWNVFLESVFLGFSAEKNFMNNVVNQEWLFGKQARLAFLLKLTLLGLPADALVNYGHQHVSWIGHDSLH